MIGGLSKSTSLLALLAATGVVMGGMAVPSAKAADLGGDCCADLEERVAELEATTARKGNRKMSLTVSGQVNRTIMYYKGPAVAGQVGTATPLADQGSDSGTFFGLDNSVSSTRFSFAGNAKVTPAVTVGFNILIDVAAGGRSDTVYQLNEDDASTGTTGDHTLRLRDANWWIEEKSLGRLTVGRLTGSAPVNTIDLGGVSVVANASWGLMGGGLAIGPSVTPGVFGAPAMKVWTDNSGDYGYRQEGVKWTSPTVAGFIASASIGETSKDSVGSGVAQEANGRIYGADLKYAGEFSGYRLAAGIGYERAVDEVSSPTNIQHTNVGGSIAVMHVASGLFLQGDYVKKDVEYATGLDRDAYRYNIQGGISKNWFGLGNTSLYGEYGKAIGWLQLNCPNAAVRGTGAALAACNGITGFGINDSDSEVRMWGLGVVQNLDAAATELYLGYRNYKFESTGFGGNPFEDLHVVAGGARVKF